MFRVLALLLVFTTKAAIAGPQEDAYQEGLRFANENMQSPLEKINTFEQKVVKEAGVENYTDNPEQTKYYHGVTAGSSKDLLDDGQKEYRYSEDDKENNASQAALKSFRKNPKVKIDPSNPNDPIIARAKHIMKNASEIVTGKPDPTSVTGPRESKTCSIEYTKKTCNEQKGPLQRVCEKVPKVVIVDDPYPGCQGHTSPGSVEDCLAGTVQIPHYRGTGHGRIVLPKKRGARVGFSDSRHPHYYITVNNETTGQQTIPRRRVSNGHYIELPISETQDQTFNFVVERWDQCTCNQPGRMNIYINRMRKMANVEWQEGSCRDI